MLSCKDVAHLASDYLDSNAGLGLSWKIRWHLAGCQCCRRFVKHLKITNAIVPHLVRSYERPRVDAEGILQRLKQQH